MRSKTRPQVPDKAPVPTPGSVAGSPRWDEISVGSLEMHAFDFDFEKARQWKGDRLGRFHVLCQRKLPVLR